MKWIVREQQKKESEFNAGSKARNDVDSILVGEGYDPLVANSELDESQGAAKKILLQFTRYGEWKKCIKSLKSGDTVVIQYPVRNHTLFFGNVLKKIQKKNVTIIGIIHDLESLRLAISENSPAVSKLRFKYEELSALKYFAKIIVHNEHMRKAIHEFFDVPMDKMVNLEIFDYLYEAKGQEEHAVFGGPVIIAGNLDKNKCGYVYDLPEDIDFALYGANYDESAQKSKKAAYMGKVKPDELPGVLKGSFGLVWDGPTGDGCTGVFGEYLKYNNPHKASLYLASGLPIIVWKESALADFVEKHGCGIIVESIDEIRSTVETMSLDRYQDILRKTLEDSQAIRQGKYMTEALRLALEID